MPELRWLREGRGAEAVIAVDFGPGRPEASFTDLAANLSRDLTVLEPVFTPRSITASPVTRAEGFFRTVVDAVQDPGYRVVGVLGYCAGAALACAMARHLATVAPPAPAVVLYDPVPAGPATLLRQYLHGVTELAKALTDDEADAARQAGVEAAADHPATTPVKTAPNLLDLATRLSDQYRMAAVRAGERLALASELTDELVNRFDAYLRYLALAAEAARGGLGGAQAPVATLLSRDHEAPAGLTGRFRRFDVPQAQLLADPDVAAATVDILADIDLTDIDGHGEPGTQARP